MILRLTITVLLILLSAGALTAGKWWHRRQVGGKTAVFATTGRPTILYFHSDDCAVCPTQSRQLQTLQAETGFSKEGSSHEKSVCAAPMIGS